MVLKDVCELLGCSVHTTADDWEKKEVGAIFAGDLMSDVLVNEGDATLLITGLNTEQVIRTADIVDACAVLLVNNKSPQKSVIDLANESDITLLSSPLSMYRCCSVLGNFEKGE